MDLSRLLATDAGMHVVWDRAHFGNVRDYTSWERELLEHEDIERHIGAGELIPINIQSDGTFANYAAGCVVDNSNANAGGV
jgi:hypothetical protein